MFGLSKSFIIVSIICILIGVGGKDWNSALIIIGVFAGLKVLWKILTE